MLVTLFPYRYLGDGNLRHLHDVFKAGDDFANGNISRIEIRGVVRPPKQGSNVIGRRSVGEEDAVQNCVSFRSPNNFPDVRTAVGA